MAVTGTERRTIFLDRESILTLQLLAMQNRTSTSKLVRDALNFQCQQQFGMSIVSKMHDGIRYYNVERDGVYPTSGWRDAAGRLGPKSLNCAVPLPGMRKGPKKETT